MTAHPEEQLSGYVDGELDEAERRDVEAHLASCAACRDVVRALQQVADLPVADTTVDEETRLRFLAEHRQRRAATEEAPAAPQPVARRALPARPRRSIPVVEGLIALAASALIAISIFVALGGPLRNMFSNAVGTQTMGQNQASLSAGIY